MSRPSFGPTRQGAVRAPDQRSRRRTLCAVLGLLPLGAGAAAWNAVAARRGGDPSAQPDGARTALLVGNARYPGAALRNPVNDARLLAEAARTVGFRTRVAENVGRPALLGALDDFLASAEDAEIRLFYFAGHGVRYQGTHYLLPADVRLGSEEDLPVCALDTDSIIDRMAAFQTGVNLLIFDACRAPIPLQGGQPRTRGFDEHPGRLQDLVARRAPRGTLIVFSTGPRQLASDGGEGPNGPFARHLATEMRRFGVPVETMLKRVRMAVMEDTRNRQVPWESSSLAGELYLARGSDW